MKTFKVGLNAFCFILWLQAYGSQGMECGVFNRYGPYRLIYAQTTPSETVHFLLPADQDAEFLATSLAPCLPAVYLDNNGLNF